LRHLLIFISPQVFVSVVVSLTASGHEDSRRPTR